MYIILKDYSVYTECHYHYILKTVNWLVWKSEELMDSSKDAFDNDKMFIWIIIIRHVYVFKFLSDTYKNKQLLKSY